MCLFEESSKCVYLKMNHQDFQVPKMEGFLNLILGVGLPLYKLYTQLIQVRTSILRYLKCVSCCFFSGEITKEVSREIQAFKQQKNLVV